MDADEIRNCVESGAIRREDLKIDPVQGSKCRDCGVRLEHTGRAGRPFERCAACREPRYAAERCHRCGKPLPKKRNKNRRFCGPICKVSAWKAANRAAQA